MTTVRRAAAPKFCCRGQRLAEECTGGPSGPWGSLILRRYEDAACAVDDVGRLVGGWVKSDRGTRARRIVRRHDGLFDSIANFQALNAAAKCVVAGKRRKPGAAAFMANLERDLLRLERELNERSYRSGRYLERPEPKSGNRATTMAAGRRFDGLERPAAPKT